MNMHKHIIASNFRHIHKGKNVHDMKVDGGSRCTAIHIFNFGDRGRSATNITPWTRFCPGKNPRTHNIGGWVDLRVVWMFGEEDTLVPAIYMIRYNIIKYNTV